MAPPSGLFGRKVFLEIFAGKAALTEAMRALGQWVVLPPVE